MDIHLDKVSYLLSEVLPQAENLRFFSKSFPDENHGTVAVPVYMTGLNNYSENEKILCESTFMAIDTFWHYYCDCLPDRGDSRL